MTENGRPRARPRAHTLGLCAAALGVVWSAACTHRAPPETPLDPADRGAAPEANAAVPAPLAAAPTPNPTAARTARPNDLPALDRAPVTGAELSRRRADFARMSAGQPLPSPGEAATGDPRRAAPQAGAAGTGTPADQGAPTTVQGTARDAKLGAVVVAADGQVYFVEGLDAWEPGFLGRTVRVTGVVRHKKLAPDPTVGPDGAVSAGMVGQAAVLASARWSLAP